MQGKYLHINMGWRQQYDDPTHNIIFLCCPTYHILYSTTTLYLHGGPLQAGVPDHDWPVRVGVVLLELLHGQLGDVVLVYLVNVATHTTVDRNSGQLSLINC